MQQSVKDRIRQFIQAKGINERRFCQIIGVSPSYVSSMRKSIQPDKISSIAEVFPDLNIGWLLTGNGSMIKTGSIKTGDINIGNVKNAGGNYGIIGKGNGNIVNNVNASGYEKVAISPGGVKLNSGIQGCQDVWGVDELVKEYNALKEMVKLLEEKCAAKDETIQAQRTIIELLRAKKE